MGVVIAITLYIIYAVIIIAGIYAVYTMLPESDIDFRLGKTL